MRRLTGAVFISIDGVMQAPGGPEEDPSRNFPHGGWTVPFWDESMGEIADRIFDGPEFDLLLGRRTYDIFEAYWPLHQDIPIGATFQRINKYVLTHASEPLQWEGSHPLSGETAEAVGRLKQSPGRDLLIQGSSTLYPPLLAAGLIDRLVLMVFPVILGPGKRIFGPSGTAGAMKLVEHAVSRSGVIFCAYAPSGEVRVGSFGDEEPGETELRRRQKLMSEEG